MYCVGLLVLPFLIHGLVSLPLTHFTEDSALRYLEQIGNSNDHVDEIDEGSAQSPVSFTQFLSNFQKFFGLSETGLLDQPTKELMTSPQCGVPDDIKNYHQATQGTRTLRTWSDKQITYRVVEYSRSERMGPVSLDRIVRNALDLWEEAADIAFVHRAIGHVDIEISFATKDHGDPGDRCGGPFDGPGAVTSLLAHAFYPDVLFCPKKFAGDVHVDDDEDWSDTYPDGLDLLHTMTHEIGHSLGLTHAQHFVRSKESPIMQKYHPGWVEHHKLKLHENDIERIQQLYGKPKTTGPYINPSAPPPTSGPDPPISDLPSKCACDSYTRFDPKSNRNEGNCQTKYEGETWCYIKKTANCPDSKTSSSVEDYNWSVEACRNKDGTQKPTPIPTSPPTPIPFPDLHPNNPPTENPNPTPIPFPDLHPNNPPTENPNPTPIPFPDLHPNNPPTEKPNPTPIPFPDLHPNNPPTENPNPTPIPFPDLHPNNPPTENPNPTPIPFPDFRPTDGICKCDDFTRYDERRGITVGNCLSEYLGETWCYILKTTNCPDSKTSNTVDSHNWSRGACQSKKDLTRTPGPCVCDPFTRFDEKQQKIVGNCQTFYRGGEWCYVKKTADCADSQATSSVDGYNWSREACSF